MFDFERKGEAEEAEDDSGPRSFLRLDRTEPPRRTPAPPPVFARVSGGPSTAVPPRGPGPDSGDRRRDPLSVSSVPSLPPEIEVPQFERDLEPPSARPIPIERAILLSLGLHLLLFLVLRWAPTGGATTSPHGLLGPLFPEPKPVDTIPLVFRSAPGPERENSRRSDLSDKTRRAGGGDPARARSETPFVPERPGIDGLAPGASKRALAAPLRTAPGESGERRATAPSEQVARSTAPDALQVPPPGPNSARAGQPLTNLDRAIREAAREVGAGEAGAGFANPDGGFVDTGGLSFESTWFEWGDYWEAFVRRVKLHWKVPLDLMILGAKGKVTITMAILADGTLADLKVVRPSGTIPFNFAAEQALRTSSPFRPLPAELLRQVPGKDRERVTVTFFYNMHPEREN